MERNCLWYLCTERIRESHLQCGGKVKTNLIFKGLVFPLNIDGVSANFKTGMVQYVNFFSQRKQIWFFVISIPCQPPDGLCEWSASPSSLTVLYYWSNFRSVTQPQTLVLNRTLQMNRQNNMWIYYLKGLCQMTRM